MLYERLLQTTLMSEFVKIPTEYAAIQVCRSEATTFVVPLKATHSENSSQIMDLAEENRAQIPIPFEMRRHIFVFVAISEHSYSFVAAICSILHARR